MTTDPTQEDRWRQRYQARIVELDLGHDARRIEALVRRKHRRPLEDLTLEQFDRDARMAARALDAAGKEES